MSREVYFVFIYASAIFLNMPEELFRDIVSFCFFNSCVRRPLRSWVDKYKHYGTENHICLSINRPYSWSVSCNHFGRMCVNVGVCSWIIYRYDSGRCMDFLLNFGRSCCDMMAVREYNVCPTFSRYARSKCNLIYHIKQPFEIKVWV